jgi:hypothetical protein
MGEPSHPPVTRQFHHCPTIGFTGRATAPGSDATWIRPRHDHPPGSVGIARQIDSWYPPCTSTRHAGGAPVPIARPPTLRRRSYPAPGSPSLRPTTGTGVTRRTVHRPRLPVAGRHGASGTDDDRYGAIVTSQPSPPSQASRRNSGDQTIGILLVRAPLKERFPGRFAQVVDHPYKCRSGIPSGSLRNVRAGQAARQP